MSYLDLLHLHFGLGFEHAVAERAEVGKPAEGGRLVEAFLARIGDYDKRVPADVEISAKVYIDQYFEEEGLEARG